MVVIGVGGRRNRVMSDDVKTGVSVHANRGVDVDGRQEREDVGLEGGDEGLEDDEGDPRGQGDRAQRLERGRGVDEQGVGGHEAQGQQQVAGDHIRHESDRQRQGPQDEVGEELDGDDERVQEPRHAPGGEGPLEVAADAVGAQPA